MKQHLAGVFIFVVLFPLPGYSASGSIDNQAGDIQKYSLYAYRDLIADFAKDGGVYVDALLEMCEVPPESKVDSVHILKSMMLSASDKFSFARMLSDNFKHTHNCIKT